MLQERVPVLVRGYSKKKKVHLVVSALLSTSVLVPQPRLGVGHMCPMILVGAKYKTPVLKFTGTPVSQQVLQVLF